MLKTFKPYVSCLQRGKIRYNGNQMGIDTLVSFDYMGSSEFEFGALPKSIKRIRDTIQTYRGKKFYIKNCFSETKIIYCFFSDKITSDDMQSIFERLAKNEISLQEYSDFDSYINNEQYYRGTNFWWDIENHFMFWAHDDKITPLLLQQIQGIRASKLNKFQLFFHKHDWEIMAQMGNKLEDYQLQTVYKCKKENCCQVKTETIPNKKLLDKMLKK